MARNDPEKDRVYAKKWYGDRKALAKKGEALDSLRCHSHKLTIIGLVMALAMSGASLWLAWRAFDASQWILGR